eukprot:Rhum_TRINITY_DN5384_c0_g1::Rhum_TRINITY_DN5384_c0_g1_i1::g.17266::m.17266
MHQSHKRLRSGRQRGRRRRPRRRSVQLLQLLRLLVVLRERLEHRLVRHEPALVPQHRRGPRRQRRRRLLAHLRVPPKALVLPLQLRVRLLRLAPLLLDVVQRHEHLPLLPLHAPQLARLLLDDLLHCRHRTPPLQVRRLLLLPHLLQLCLLVLQAHLHQRQLRLHALRLRHPRPRPVQLRAQLARVLRHAVRLLARVRLRSLEAGTPCRQLAPPLLQLLPRLASLRRVRRQRLRLLAQRRDALLRLDRRLVRLVQLRPRPVRQLCNPRRALVPLPLQLQPPRGLRRRVRRVRRLPVARELLVLRRPLRQRLLAPLVLALGARGLLLLEVLHLVPGLLELRAEAVRLRRLLDGGGLQLVHLAAESDAFFGQAAAPLAQRHCVGLQLAAPCGLGGQLLLQRGAAVGGLAQLGRLRAQLRLHGLYVLVAVLADLVELGSLEAARVGVVINALAVLLQDVVLRRDAVAVVLDLLQGVVALVEHGLQPVDLELRLVARPALGLEVQFLLLEALAQHGEVLLEDLAFLARRHPAVSFFLFYVLCTDRKGEGSLPLEVRAPTPPEAPVRVCDASPWFFFVVV